MKAPWCLKDGRSQLSPMFPCLAQEVCHQMRLEQMQAEFAQMLQVVGGGEGEGGASGRGRACGRAARPCEL